jgi:L-rhamnose mutarotase
MHRIGVRVELSHAEGFRLHLLEPKQEHWRPMTQRSAFVLRIPQENLDAYVEAHRNVWPDMLQTLRRAGIRNYTIFSAGTDAFGYYEGDDLDRAAAILAADPVNKRWQDEMAVILGRRLPDAGPPSLQEIFRVD